MTNTLTVSRTTTQLKTALADTYTLLLKTQNYHWNITGPSFYNFHILFETLYVELFAAVDELAERVRTSGSFAPGSFAEFNQLTTIKEAQANIDASSMVDDLFKSNLDVVMTLTKLRDLAADEGDSATEDIAIARIKAHQKATWMLKASL